MSVSPQVLALAEAIEAVLRTVQGSAAQPTPPASPPEPETWRSRLWTADPQVRLGVREVAEALGRPRSFVYRAVRRDLPHRKLAGELVVTVAELRRWIQDHEVAAGPAALVVTRRRAS